MNTSAFGSYLRRGGGRGEGKIVVKSVSREGAVATGKCG